MFYIFVCYLDSDNFFVCLILNHKPNMVINSNITRSGLKRELTPSL